MLQLEHLINYLLIFPLRIMKKKSTHHISLSENDSKVDIKSIQNSYPIYITAISIMFAHCLLPQIE